MFCFLALKKANDMLKPFIAFVSHLMTCENKFGILHFFNVSERDEKIFGFVLFLEFNIQVFLSV
jgi:hypothetical protein